METTRILLVILSIIHCVNPDGCSWLVDGDNPTQLKVLGRVDGVSLMLCVRSCLGISQCTAVLLDGAGCKLLRSSEGRRHSRHLSAQHVRRISWPQRFSCSQINQSALGKIKKRKKSNSERCRSHGYSPLSRHMCVKLVQKGAKTWHAAKKMCEAEGADLVSVNTKTKFGLFYKYLTGLGLTGAKGMSKFQQKVWIGLRVVGNSWQWSNGAPLTYHGFKSTPAATRGHCARFSRGAVKRWLSVPCANTEFMFGCEIRFIVKKKKHLS